MNAAGTITRVPRLLGWQPALARLVAVEAARPFAYGSWDCALFVARAVWITTGRDIRPAWTYASRTEGVRKMRAAGYRDHVSYMSSLFATLPDPGQALAGDIAVMPGRSLGIVQGRWVYQVTPTGLGVSPRADMLKALAV